MTLPLMFSSLVGWHVMVLLGVMVLPVAALVSIAVIRSVLSPVQIVAWAAVVILVPVVGALAWFAVGLWYHRAAGRAREARSRVDLAERERIAREADAQIAISRAAAAEQRRNDQWGAF